MYPENDNKVIKLEIEIIKPYNVDVNINGMNFYAKTIDWNFI